VLVPFFPFEFEQIKHQTQTPRARLASGSELIAPGGGCVSGVALPVPEQAIPN
jgi:hypothetical protein